MASRKRNLRSHQPPSDTAAAPKAGAAGDSPAALAPEPPEPAVEPAEPRAWYDRWLRAVARWLPKEEGPGATGRSWPEAGKPRRLFLALAVALGVFCIAVTAWTYTPAVNMPLTSESYVSQRIGQNVPLYKFFIRSAFLQKGEGQYYRPLTRIFDTVYVRATGGMDGPKGHFFSIFMHCACVGLLFVLVLQLTRGCLPAAAVGALWFGLHPSLSSSAIYVSIRWNLYAVLFFLITVNLYVYILQGRQWRGGAPPLWVGLAMILPVAILGFTGEIGTVAMGAVGLWLMIRTLARGDWRWPLRLLLPLGPVPIIYLALRRYSLGSMGATYLERELSTAEWLRINLSAFIHDITIIINPLHLDFLAIRPTDSAGKILLGLAVCVVPMIVAVAVPATRRLLWRHPMVVIGLLAFLFVQYSGVWRIEREPIAEAGIHRSYVFSFCIMILAILLGSAFAAVWDRARGRWRVPAQGIAGLLALVLLASSWNLLRASVADWRASGDMMRSHREILEPIFEELPEGTQVYVTGFPDFIRNPYRPWALSYFVFLHGIFEYWAEPNRIQVTYDGRHLRRPENFVGMLVERNRETGKIVVRPYDYRDVARNYIRFHEARPPVDPARLLPRPGPNPVEGTYLGFLELLGVSDNGEMRLRSTGVDPSIGVAVSYPPILYGVIAYDIRIPPGQAGSQDSYYTQVFVRGPGQQYSEGRSLGTHVPGDGEWHTVRLPFFDRSEYLNIERVETLRMDFVDAPVTFDLRHVRLENDLEWAREVVSGGAE